MDIVTLLTPFNSKHLSLKRNNSVPHRPRRIVQDRDRGLKPPAISTEKHPQTLQRIRQHQPGQVLPRKRTTDSNMQSVLRPFKLRLLHRIVSVGRGDRFATWYCALAMRSRKVSKWMGGPYLLKMRDVVVSWTRIWNGSRGHSLRLW